MLSRSSSASSRAGKRWKSSLIVKIYNTRRGSKISTTSTICSSRTILRKRWIYCANRTSRNSKPSVPWRIRSCYYLLKSQCSKNSRVTSTATCLCCTRRKSSWKVWTMLRFAGSNNFRLHTWPKKVNWTHSSFSKYLWTHKYLPSRHSSTTATHSSGTRAKWSKACRTRSSSSWEERS